MAGWAGGVAAQWLQPVLWAGWCYGVMVAAGLVFTGLWWALARNPTSPRRPPPWTIPLCAVLATSLLGFGTTGGRALMRQADVLAPQWEERPLWLTGTVDALPQSHPDGAVLVVATDSAELDGQVIAVSQRLRLFWPQAPGNLQAGQVWRWPVRLRAPHGLANPHGFDRELWLWVQGIGATGVVRSGKGVAPPQLLGANGLHVVERWRGGLAEAVRERVADPRIAGIVAALLVGQQSAIDREDWQVFRDTGVAHLMSISGLHITLFAWLATRLVGMGWRAMAPWRPGLLLRWPVPHAAALGGLVLATAYAVLAGWGIPAQRTVFMLAVISGLRWRAHDWPRLHVWLMCLTVVLLLDPWAGLQAGFWLSFVAVLLLFSSEREPQPQAVVGMRRGWFALKGLVREQLVMTLALAPLTLLLFGQVSVVGLLANLVAIPWVTLVITPLVFVGVLVPLAWDVAAWGLHVMVSGLLPLARWPGAVWHAPAVPLGLAVCAVGGAWLACLRLPWAWRCMGVLCAWPALTFVPARPPVGEFELRLPDVGQGSAVLVRTAHHSLLYDAGARYRHGGDVGEQVVVPWLRGQGERLDALVISHRDSDHAGGAASVLKAHPQAQWLASYVPDGGPLGTGRAGSWLADGLCLAGQRWQWDGVQFEIMHPTPQDVTRPGVSSNALSCVLRIGNGQRSAWLVGDVGRDEEVALASRHGAAGTDLLVAPHHGSKSSSSPVWLNVLMPSWVLIQAGHHNRFGHPAPEVLDRYAARGARWQMSSVCGEMRWRSDAPADVLCHRQTQRRYWQWRTAQERGTAERGESGAEPDTNERVQEAPP